MKDAKELQRLLQDVDSRSLLVPQRILRRIIKTDRDIGGLGLQVPHRKTYVIEREPLLRIASPGELDVPQNRKLPKTLLLLQRPDDDWINNTERNEILVQYWQFLFHARLDHETHKQLDNNRLNEETVFEHVQMLGQIEFEEINAVLRQERYLLPPINPRTVFAEFLAVYFELHYFARPLLAHYFPAIENHALVHETLSKVVNAERIYQDTRLKNSPDPVMRKGFTDETLVEGLSLLIPAGFDPRKAKCETLCEKAKLSTERGNVVRAALLLKKALDIAPPEEVDRIQREANVALDQLAYRLHAALQLHDKETEEWRALLPALLEPASKGVWSISARLLYDLQKVCVDHERDIFELDLGESLRTIGRRPMRRFLPYYADVLLVKHLRSAASRLAGTPVEDEERRRLSIILRAAVHHAEHRLRERIRPILEQVLDDVELKAANFPEQVARLKMIEEMLDRITHWGFLTMSDVRDAISRNQIKLPDLGGVKELVLGDQLLKIDRKLKYELDGIYRRGEIYLRGLQRLSALTFGTRPGRWLTLFVLLPFGGAFATIVFILEMMHLAGLGHVHHPPEFVGSVTGSAAAADLDQLGAMKDSLSIPPALMGWLIGGLGIFILLCMHVASFRKRVWVGTVWIGGWLSRIFLHWPFQFFQLPWVRSILDSPPMLLFRRVLLRPFILTAFAAGVTLLSRGGTEVLVWVSSGTFVAGFLLFNSRAGRTVDETVTDWAMRNWDWLRADVIPGLIHYTMIFFKRCLDTLEKIIYSVDEWLRFRSGDSRWSLFFKPILGMLWRAVTYFLRVLIALFVEPTFNPIKHFPAVTVAAKLMVPFFPLIHVIFMGPVADILGFAVASILEGLVIFFLPGLAGFMAWELKENWKLYAANRKAKLDAVPIGSHGETITRFFKPGFHSGTLPRLYQKLRKAEREANGRAFFKHHEALHHVVEDLRNFLERELLMLLHASKAWGDTPMYVGMMQLATNRIKVEICSTSFGQKGFWLVFEWQSEWLLAGIESPGWIPQLNTKQTKALRVALAGLYKLAGVEIIHEQLRTQLPTRAQSYRLADEEVLLLIDSDFQEDERIPLTEEYLYTDNDISWQEWISIWKADQDGTLEQAKFLDSIRILPKRTSALPG